MKVKELLKIENSIDNHIPIMNNHLDLLNKYMNFGNPTGRLVFEENGSHLYKIFMEPRSIKPDFFTRGFRYRPLEAATIALLCQPAFALAQKFQNSYSQSRFTGQCRAPSCGKLFYTGRKNATACPAKNSTSKSRCALEWIRYKRFLQKINKNPEQCWGNEKLKQRFIKYYNS